MNRVLFRNLVLIAWAFMAVTACRSGGGGSDGGNGIASSGGTGGTGVSYGSVSGFGSVFVNGVEFDTTNSTVTLNGSPGPDESVDPHRGLMTGMVVKVDGTFDGNGTTGTASSITFKDDLTGPVSSITSIISPIVQIVTLGQNVIVDSQTVFSGTTLTTLSLGNVIEVSGLPDNNGDIHATYIEFKAGSFVPGLQIGVKGTIHNLNPVLKTFQINALTVDYSLATNLPPGVPANGQFVEVKGTNLLGIVLIADSVALDDNSLGTTDAGIAQMEGYVTALTSPSAFTVGVQPVQTTASTVFDGGTAGDVAAGVKLRVQGSLAGGILTATKISFL
jgi:Domain of unknown function (DUF5666)